MSLWEYKVITSGKGGFATPALLEKFLNDLGREEWEIVDFHTLPDNFLAFTGLARRPTQRDWTLEGAAAAAAKVEAEKLRAEFEAKFKAATTAGAASTEERPASLIEEKLAPDDGFRKLVDTSHDADPDADEEEKDDWDKLTAAEEDEVPSFFDAIKPHLRRNQRGPGQSVGVDYLAKKWDQSEDDLKGALVECGFELPSDEDTRPVYLEYDGDLYWLNINRRGELWINTKEKPRPMFKAVKAQRVAEEPGAEVSGADAGGQKAETRGRRSEAAEQRAEAGNRRAEDKGQRSEDRSHGAEAAGEAAAPTSPAESAPSAIRDPQSAGGNPLPAGLALLEKIRPHMRRNRRGPGGSGSASFLSRALRTNEADLTAAFAALGLALPASAQEQPVYLEMGDALWWLNRDSRGGLWINGREKRPGETAASANAAPPEAAPSGSAAERPQEAETPIVGASEDAASAGAPAASSAADLLGQLRAWLEPAKAGSAATRLDALAERAGKPTEELVAKLTAAGLKVPEKSREKPVLSEHAGEVFWLTRNAKDELWLNAKPAKSDEKKPSRGRTKKE